jgi:hypothetical protein
LTADNSSFMARKLFCVAHNASCCSTVTIKLFLTNSLRFVFALPLRC